LKQAAKNEICPLIKALTQIPQADSIRLFLCGDVMTGRGIDQVLPHPNDARLHEPYIAEVRSYVELAERVNGANPAAGGVRLLWGDALAELDRAGPLEERVEVQVLSVDLRKAVMACLSGGESRRWTVLELVERFKSQGVCASRAGVTAALVELGLELELSSSRAVGACSNEGPNGSWSPNQRS
jgi:hypothetical protein